MPAFVIVEVDIKDPTHYSSYKDLAQAAVKQFGGKYIARGGRALKLEGDAEPKRVVILEFESVEQAQKWWNSPEYSAAKKIRHAAAESRMIVVEGLEVPI